MLYWGKGNEESTALVQKKAAGATRVNDAEAGFLSIEDFKKAALTRLAALKATYLQKLQARPEGESKP
ncbi:hypothetical protein GU926_08415 [Nibribacter ruber]|uniref:Uncharacterized protein n=1 Tax=Nibribacter ruber TaxID=2698458 RepID=A0A6P1NWP2_9BACT|nr:hypothetical protein [Nibribacter ruber]QHL87460.1 hypothetical protein GU926_08415 [Nibribacter ruber]